MILNERETLRLVEEKLSIKIHSLHTWDEFIAWAKGITGPTFKAFILQCIDEVTANTDTIKSDLAEIKARFEEP